MKRLIILFILSLSACKTPDEEAKQIIVDYLNAHGKHDLVFDAEHDLHHDSKYEYSFQKDITINGRYMSNTTYVIKFDSTLSKIISCEGGKITD